MKTVANVSPKWPDILNKKRMLVVLFRNRTYRKWLRRALRKKGIDVSKLEHFGATIAKWRYQTVPLAQCALLELRYICQLHMSREFFAHSKDQTFIKSVFDVCEDQWFWIYMEGSYTFVFRPCEECRRMGMTCTCPQHIDLRKGGQKHVPCFWNGRKLAQAWPDLEIEKEATREIARTMTPDKVEGNVEICSLIKNHAGEEDILH